MKSIGDAIQARLFEPPKRGPNSPRAAVVEDLCKFMGEDPGKRMKYWLGRTKLFSPGEIYRMMSEARQGRKPRALFEHILKQDTKALKDLRDGKTPPF